nr:ATP synthase CF0 B subunit [Cylindrocapsa geminella]
MTMFLFHGFFIAEGFGINTNIFETNIINLTAVLGIVISFVGNNLTSILEERKKIILNNLQEATQRVLDAQEKLSQAFLKLENAKEKAKKIREEGILRADLEIKQCVSQHELRLSRLVEFKEETIKFSQKKASKQASLYVISRLLVRVKERLNLGLDSTYHVAVNNFYVSRFTQYDP